MKWYRSGNPKESSIVVIKTIPRRGIIKEGIAVYDAGENVFFQAGKRINNVMAWRYKR